jgi:hypothetical protein
VTLILFIYALHLSLSQSDFLKCKVNATGLSIYVDVTPAHSYVKVQGGGTRRRKVGGETHTFDQSSTASHHKTAVRKTTHDGISSNLSIEPLGDKPTLDGPSSVVRWTKPFLFLLPMNTPVDFMISVELTSGLLELSHLRKPQLRCL